MSNRAQQIDDLYCTRCGERIKGDRVYAIYGDPGLAHKDQISFTLDQKCFDENEKVTVAEWRNDENDNPVLVEFEITRYVKV